MQDMFDKETIRKLLSEKRSKEGLLLSETAKILDIDIVDMILFDSGKQDLSDKDLEKIEAFLTDE